VIDLLTSTRVQILSKLIERPYTASEIAKITGYSKTTVSYHLSKLNEAGLVERLERGKWVYYKITPKGERRVKVEAAISLASLAGAVISAAISALKYALKFAEKPLMVAERTYTPPATGINLELIVALILISIFVYLKFRK